MLIHDLLGSHHKTTGTFLSESEQCSDRHVKKHGNGEPLVDSSQDYVLLLGYENQTHTVLRFKRKLDTCDVAYDVPITITECT
uniref:DOMON domain-containing protein n=1 Tax=Anopheles dirus TaxID=7168 RepID=A0A182MXN9_9DIPT